MMDFILLWRGQHESVDSMFLLATPIPLVVLLGLYLYFVVWFGPNMMRNQKPKSIRQAIIPYNVFQIFSSVAIIVGFYSYGFTFENTWRCVKEPEDDEIKDGIHYVMWWFLVLRIFELMETVFFVLRKKWNQITFLHVVHHVSSISIFWMFLKYSGGMMEVFFVVVSEIAHIIKYCYFMLSSYTNVTKLYRFLIFIKPVMIVLQMLELVLILGHSVRALLPDCDLSSLFYLQIVNVIALLVLYAQLFINCYLKRLGIRHGALNYDRNVH